MYPVSADFHNLSIADAPTSRVRIYFIEANVDCTDDNDVQSNGTLLCMPGETDSNGRIEKGGVTINEFFNSDTNVQIGATVSSQIGMTLINRDGALDGFNYGRCKVYIDVYDDTNSTWLTCPMGVYNIAIPKRRKVQLVSATGYDQMQQLDEIADSWWNGLDWSNGINVLQIIQSMAATLGIHLSANTSANIVNSGLSYTEIPFTAIEMTYRDILSYIAETTGTIARFDRNGALDLRWFSDAVLSTDTQTYAGGLVTFTATNRASISSLSVPFSPIQDLHGYDHPWPAGGGSNLLDFANPSVTSKIDSITGNGSGGFTVVVTGGSAYMNYVIPVKAGETYCIYCDSVDGSISGLLSRLSVAYVYDGSDTSGTVLVNGQTVTAARTFTPQQSAITVSWRSSTSTESGTGIVNGPRVNKGSAPSASWTPYSNICPITGRTGCEVYRTGKNLADVSNAANATNVVDSVDADGKIHFKDVTARWSSTYIGKMFVKAGETYTLSGGIAYGRIGLSTNTSYPQTGVNIPDITVLGGGSEAAFLTKNRTVNSFTANYTGYMYAFYCSDVHYAEAHGEFSCYVFCNVGSTATTYEPYNGNTYAVDWTSQAGTVYGGTLDVVTGVLTVDKASVDLGLLNWTYLSSYGGFFVSTGIQSLVADKWECIAEAFKNVRLNAVGITNNDGAICINRNGSDGSVTGATEKGNIVATYKQYTDATLFKAAVNGTYLCYELATPLTYRLTGQEITALVGTNNVWSTGDSVSVTVSEPTLVEIQTDTVGNQCLSIDVGEYQVSQIDALSVKASQADVGVTIGSGGNAYTILDNPMLFGDEAAITTKATPIYNRLSAFRLFTPISMRCIMDWSIEAGDIITVTNESVTYDLPIFQQRLRWRGGYVVSDLFSNGEQERPTQSKEIRSSFRSNTQLHEFEVTLEQLRSYIQSVDGNYTLIQQTVDAIAQTVANQNVTIQNILDPTGEIWTAITKNTSDLSSIEDSLNNEITERRSYIRLIPSEPAIVMGVDEDNEIKLKLVNNIIYFFNGADDSTDLSLAYAYFNSQEAFADRFVAGESLQIGTNDNAVHWLWQKLNNGDLVLELVG